MELTNILSLIGTLISATGLIITGLGVFYVGRQLKDSRKTAEMSEKIARNDFFLKLQERNDRFDQIHLRLRGAGWPDGRDGPETDEEWLEVSRYLGHLESLKLLIDDGIISLRDVDKFYSHRIYNIVRNPKIRKRFLEEASLHWQDFKELWHLLENLDTYQKLAGSDKQKALTQ